MKTSFTFFTIAGAAFLAQVAFGLPPDFGGLPRGDLLLHPDSGIDCASFVTGSVTVAPASIQVGDSATLSWSVSIPDRCTEKGITVGGQPVGKQGSMTIQPPLTQSYVLKQDAKTLDTARIEVGYPDHIIIDARMPDPVQVLVVALEQANRIVDGKPVPIVVELCDVDLDMTGHSLIINADRSLIASPDCARGPRRLGPRIFVTEIGKTPFTIIGDNVRFSGFRLEGPTSGIRSAEEPSEAGIIISPSSYDNGLIHNIEISNMEMSHWSGSAISVSDNDNAEIGDIGRLNNMNVGAVHIKNNFIHHNRHAGLGYGVSMGGGAYALIEQNVFDENRHAIAGGTNNFKKDYSGYTARDNLILPGGGVACSSSLPVDAFHLFIEPWNFGRSVCWQTHQIDMHGDQNLAYSSHNWQCGTAGETIIIERNTILYTAGDAISIRGNPADKAVVDGNVFKHERSDAISQGGDCGNGDNITNPIDVRPNNVFKVRPDPTTELGSCDFFGDGKQDQFMATGVTWWAISPTTLQWRYLNTMPERLPQLALGNFDNDGKCDVALGPSNPRLPLGPRTYSKNGTGPWVPVHGIVER